MALSALAADLDGAAAAAAEDPDEGSAEAVAAPATPAAAAADAEPISDTIASQHGASVASEGRVALTYFLTLR